MHPETIAVHAGRMIDPSTGAVSPPLHLSTTFERDADGQFSRGYAYVRDDNPNRRALETCLASLEGGVAAVAFPSGMAAISAALEALALKYPGPILLPQDMYFGIRSLLTETSFGRALDVVSVDMTDLSAVERACAGAKPGIVWAETPSNPLVGITDLAGRRAHRAGARCSVCRRQHLGDAAPPATARLRCRSRRAFAHEICRWA